MPLSSLFSSCIFQFAEYSLTTFLYLSNGHKFNTQKRNASIVVDEIFYFFTLNLLGSVLMQAA